MNKWLIMFAGIGTVFVALIAIIAIIQVFHLIFGKRPGPKKQKTDREPASQAKLAKPAPAPAVETKSTGLAQAGGELVAVIAASIAAASGLSPSSFRIASVRSAGDGDGEGGFNTPVWGRIERFNR
ncbi:MAG: OadG family protein [Spirochaetia bacterium]|nr:OadG family protein [Spirochaetia bacterium]MCE1210058.1 OadG family protein [Spirochaetia bacterium]